MNWKFDCEVMKLYLPNYTHYVKSVQIRNFFWSIFGYFSYSDSSLCHLFVLKYITERATSRVHVQIEVNCIWKRPGKLPSIFLFCLKYLWIFSAVGHTWELKYSGISEFQFKPNLALFVNSQNFTNVIQTTECL